MTLLEQERETLTETPSHDELVLDFMHFVVGWSSPHVSVRGSGT